MARIRADYVFGTTDAALTDTDTTLSSPGLASLPAVASPDIAAVTLYDGTNYEIVHVTAHTASATTATILRGQEGSTTQAWSTGATWHLGPTAADETEDVVATGTITKLHGPITQAAYDALTPDADTLYVIVG